MHTLKHTLKQLRRGCILKASTYQTIDEKEILDKVFSFPVKQGLEGASIREICKGTGIVQGSLYYWFNDKATIICEATEYGLKKVSNEIFRYVFENISDMNALFSGVLDEISKYKKELRFIYTNGSKPGIRRENEKRRTAT